jgi:hypothetical protein
MRPSAKKRSATACWVATMSSVISPMAKAERRAAMVWIARSMPVTPAS